MRIAIFAGDDFSLWQPRRGLIKYLIEQGCEVWIICAAGKYVDQLKELGARYFEVKIDLLINPWADIRLLFKLASFFRQNQINVVQNLTTKPNIFGTFAAWFAGVPRIIISVEGLGRAFSGTPTFRSRCLQFILSNLYRIACRLAYRTRFMNPDDEQFFLEKKLVHPKKSILIIGEGVNLSEYSPGLIDQKDIDSFRQLAGGSIDTIYITMVTRPLWIKGVKEFIEASEILSAEFKNVKFILVGPLASGDSAVPKAYLEGKESKSFKYVGFAEDLRHVFGISDIVVLPSFTREGVPNCLIEAMASGIPIVTTDNTGCRECVDDGKTGFLVPVRDSQALAKAISVLVKDRSVRERFGKASREKVENDFNERRVYERLYSEAYTR